MKKIFFFIILLTLLSILAIQPGQALAYSFSDATGFYESTAGGAQLKTKDYIPIVAAAIRLLMGFAGGLFVLLFIYGGITWMSAGGHQEKVDKAKKAMIYATLGIFIVIAAFSISMIISRAFQGGGGGEEEKTGGIDTDISDTDEDATKGQADQN